MKIFSFCQTLFVSLPLQTYCPEGQKSVVGGRVWAGVVCTGAGVVTTHKETSQM